nr:venom protein U-MPTX.7-44 [Megalopyge opercularis]
MKTSIILIALAVVAAAEYYDSKYDSFNEQEVIDNDRLLKAYCLCFLDQGPCTEEGKQFKNLIPDALENDCAKCSPKQKPKIRNLMNALHTKYAELYNNLMDKYDAGKKHRETIEKFLAASD